MLFYVLIPSIIGVFIGLILSLASKEKPNKRVSNITFILFLLLIAILIWGLMDLFGTYDFLYGNIVMETLMRIYNQGIPLLGIIISSAIFVFAVIGILRICRLKTANNRPLARYILYGLSSAGVFIISCIWVDYFWGAIMGI